MTMYTTHQQEEFSRAYVHAVASAAGLKFTPGPLPDDDSVDATIAARGLLGMIRSPRMDLQIKCRMGPALGDPISYPLDIKNYEDLRPTDLQAPRILVVVFVPDVIADWTHHTEQELALRNCGYWISLRGLGPTTNKTSVTVHLKRSNVLNVEGLNALMARIGKGDPP